MGFYVGETEEAALLLVSDFFVKRGMLAHYVRDTDAVRLRSRPWEEPDDGKRFRRVTYDIKLSLFGSRPDCTWVEVRWTVTSRGFREGRWTVDDDDPGFRPMLRDELIDLFRGLECRESVEAKP